MTDTRVLRAIRREVWANSGGYCDYCGQLVGEEDRTVDHVVPISKGGSAYTVTNARAACYNCNALKGDNDIDHFRATLALRSRYLPRGHPMRQGVYRFHFEREGRS